MSDAVLTSAPAASAPSPTAGRTTRRGRRRAPLRLLAGAAGLLVLLALPLYVGSFWLDTGFSIFGAAIGAVGLTLLVGTTGQLSLAHAFFLAIGALTYTYVSGEPGGVSKPYSGWELPPLVGMVAGIGVAGLAGLVVSPMAARLRGIYLGIATLGLVFIGEHIFNTWTSVSGGFNGRLVPPFELFGFSFAGNDGPYLEVLGVPFGRSERLWYLGLTLCIAACWFAANLLRSRPGRALQMVRDSEVAGSVIGIDIQDYKAKVFLISSMYAGLAGVLFALSIGSIAPESFSLRLSILYLAMVVLGGLGSVRGAVLGAVFVTALPLVFGEYAASLPFIVEPGEPGIIASQAAAFLFGLAIILVVLFEPAGLVGLGHRLRHIRGRRPVVPHAGSGTHRAENPPSAPADPSSGGNPT